MNDFHTSNLLRIDKTIAHEIFSGTSYPWDVLPEIIFFIQRTGPLLDANRFLNPSKNIWIAKTAKVAHTASIEGPCIIDEDAEIRHCALIRGNVVIGKNVVVGNSTELKNCLLFDCVQVPHYNYIGDSILGYKAHFGAGAIASNVRCDKKLVTVKDIDKKTFINTGLKKFGAIVGDFVEVGCNAVLCPGTVIGRDSIIYPQARVRGVIPAENIFKDSDKIIKKQIIERG